jgi:hypothetical protein
MKTALTEWFDELKANYPYMANEIFDKGFSKYLEKEKEQIMRDYKNGKVEAKMPNEVNTTGTEYYNQTYNQNK